MFTISNKLGKSTIKPESLTEINRIDTLMKEEPGLKFSVEVHTGIVGVGDAAADQAPL